MKLLNEEQTEARVQRMWRLREAVMKHAAKDYANGGLLGRPGRLAVGELVQDLAFIIALTAVSELEAAAGDELPGMLSKQIEAVRKSGTGGCGHCDACKARKEAMC